MNLAWNRLQGKRLLHDILLLQYCIMINKLRQQKINGRLLPVFDLDLKNFPKEKWKDIPGYEGIYQLSSFGRIKSLARVIEQKNGTLMPVKERIKKVSIHVKPTSWLNKFGYKENYVCEIVLRMENVPQHSTLGRYMYYLFVAPFDLDDQTQVIQHKDGDPFNFRYKNLRLRPFREMITEGYTTTGRKNGFDKKKRKVHQYDLEGSWLNTYDSIAEATKATRGNPNQIGRAALNQWSLSGCCYWRFGRALPRINVAKYSHIQRKLNYGPKERAVRQFNFNGKLLATYISITAATKAIGAKSVSGISYAIKNGTQSMGYKWKS